MPIIRPTFLIDKKKCLSNIEFMASKAKRHNLIFRPHFKTHNSAQVGEWFRDFGVTAITVSSVEMAQTFIKAGWKDITIAFPFNILEKNNINKISEDVAINLLIDSSETATLLFHGIKRHTGIFIEIDTGYHRSGLLPEDFKQIELILYILNKSSLLKFKGFLVHTGENYSAKSVDEIMSNHNRTVDIMYSLKNKYKDRFPELIVSIGDTPGCSLSENFAGVDEIRPGNFVYYDIMQAELGSCSTRQIAVAVACPIVGLYPDRKEAVVHCGAIHLSKESIIRKDGTKIFGLIAEFDGSGWVKPFKKCYVSSLSQEHGILHLEGETINNYRVGDIICILPVHSCLVAAAMGKFVIV